MLTFFVIAVMLDMCNAMVAIITWRLLPRVEARPVRVRTFGAAIGGIGAALLTKPQLEVLVRYLGYVQEQAGMATLFAFPFALPVSVALGAWLLAEAVGGKSPKLGRALGMSFLGSLLGAALAFLPLFFVPGATRFIPYAVAMALPIAGALLGLFLEGRWREGVEAPVAKVNPRQAP